MGFLDFLSQGSTPPASTTGTDTVGSMPLWYSQYMQAMANNASAIGSTPYTPYTGARVAGFNPDQQASFDITRNNAENGAWKGTLNQASQAATAGAQPFSQSGLNQFMSPYQGAVTDEIARLGNRNLNENLMPALQNEFVGSGGFGSSRDMDMSERLVRDVGADISGQQTLANQQGFQNAIQNYGGWQDRMTNASKNLSGLAQTQGQMPIQQAGALSATGQQQQGLQQQGLDLGYQDYQNQMQYPYQQLGFQSNILQGQNIPNAQSSTTTGPYQGYMSASPLSQLAGLYSLGRGSGTVGT